MENETSRRHFLKQLALAGSFIVIPPYLHSCDRAKNALMDGADAPFGVWRQMLEALEKSPDHLLGRRKALIAAKNPNAMIEFVRDSIQLLPQVRSFLRHAGSNMNFGAEGALRSGLATPREKAEILKAMLVDAGFEARVVLEQISFTEEELKAIVFRRYQPEFNPVISQSQMESWQKSLGAASSNGTVKEIKDAQKQVENFYTQFFAEMGESYDYRKFGNDFRAPDGDSIPSVTYIVEGEEKYGHVFDPSTPAGSLHSKNVKQSVSESREISLPKRDINISLTYRTAVDPQTEKELLTGTWGLEDLIGSTLSLQFLNNMDFKQQVRSSIAQIDSFTPSFSFQKIGAEKEYMERLTVVGEPINLNGQEILSKAEELGTNKEPGNTNSITNLSINAIPLAFPQTRVEIFPTDAEGKVVEGLTAANFELKDNQNIVYGRLEKNVISPKIMLLYDTSISMPQTYRSEEHIDHFIKELKATVHDYYPHAEIKAQATGSDIYTSLLRAKQSEFDLIMYATDGDNNDTFDPKYLEVYETGQPILILEVRPGNRTYAELKKNIPNLVSIPAADQNRARTEIKSILSGLSFPPYVLTYQSFGEQEEHTLQVKLNDKDLSDQQQFRFPEPNDNYLGERMIGLYLKIQGNGTSERRTLAGWDTEIVRYAPARSYIDEVREMLLGGAVMAFEGEVPSLSVRLTEYLTAMLSHEKWFNAQKEGDFEQAIKYLEEGTLSYQPLLLTMMQPLSEAFNQDTITFPNGFRSCLIKMKPGLYSTNTTLSFDYLPTSNYLTFNRSGEGKVNFVTNLKKTMEWAVLEAAMFEDSTLAQLKDKKIIELVKARKDPAFNSSLPKDLNPIFSNRIFKSGELTFFDNSFTSAAYFKINNQTGELYANLPDGSGGGGNSTLHQLQELDRVVKEYEELTRVLQVSGLVAPGLGAVATYNMRIVKLYALASEAIIIMDPGDINGEMIEKAIAELACNLYKDLIYLSMGRVGQAMSGIEILIALMGGEFTFYDCSS